MATKKYYRVPECPMALSLATHPGELTKYDVQGNLVRAMQKSQEQAKRDQAQGMKGDCWAWELEHNYFRDQGSLPMSMQQIEWGADERDWENADSEDFMWRTAERLTGDWVEEPADDDYGRELKRQAGVGETLEEITSPEDLEELEDVLAMCMAGMTEYLPSRHGW